MDLEIENGVPAISLSAQKKVVVLRTPQKLRPTRIRDYKMEENMNTPVQENAVETPKKGGGLVVAAFILAIVSFIVCWFPLLGWLTYITATLAVIFGIIGLIKKQKKVLAIISLVLAGASWIIYYLVVKAAAEAAAADWANSLMNM
ncbi:MAG: hypothetical protein J6T33_09230 [Bacteroidales bacterium]|nr:hypothetical protein [Bacteroidales bacterium]